MDPLLNIDLATKLNNASMAETNGSSISIALGENYNHLISCKTLIDNLLKEATTTDSANISSYVRGQQFLRDLKKQSDDKSATLTNTSGNVSFSGISSNAYWVIFHPGDVMAVRLNYIPKNGSGEIVTDNNGALLGSNKIYERSYKIYLKMS